MERTTTRGVIKVLLIEFINTSSLLKSILRIFRPFCRKCILIQISLLLKTMQKFKINSKEHTGTNDIRVEKLSCLQ